MKKRERASAEMIRRALEREEQQHRNAQEPAEQPKSKPANNKVVGPKETK